MYLILINWEIKYIYIYQMRKWKAWEDVTTTVEYQYYNGLYQIK